MTAHKRGRGHRWSMVHLVLSHETDKLVSHLVRDGHMASCPQLKYVRPGSESLVENPKAYVTERRSIESTRSTNSSIPRLRETSPVPTCYLGGCAEIAVAAATLRPPPPIPVAAAGYLDGGAPPPPKTATGGQHRANDGL